jgi:hypothetical protein
LAGQFAESAQRADFFRREPEFEGRNITARYLYQRLGFEIVNEEEIQFHMSPAPRASAETQAE